LIAVYGTKTTNTLFSFFPLATNVCSIALVIYKSFKSDLKSLELFSTSNKADATESSKGECFAEMLLCNLVLNA